MSATCSVSQYLALLSHELVRYDVATSKREMKRGRVNIYRMGLLLEAFEKTRVAVGKRTGDSAEDKSAFVAAMLTNFERGFQPVEKVLKQIAAGTCKIK